MKMFFQCFGFLCWLATFASCVNAATASNANDIIMNDPGTKLAVGDCMDFSPSAFMVAAPNPKKVPCDSEKAKSKITKITKDKSDCEGGGYVTTYGADKNKTYYCVKNLKKE